MEQTIKRENLEDLLDNAATEECIFFNKILVIEYQINPFFTVQGRAACVHPNTFDLEIGRDICKQDAISKLWELEGYALSLELNKSRDT